MGHLHVLGLCHVHGASAVSAAMILQAEVMPLTITPQMTFAGLLPYLMHRCQRDLAVKWCDFGVGEGG